ncbi:MAG: hypothetical protein HZB15_00270 [Actinobacteria bacterium]|nr:hypothetical protein [Actinomycetota bacterium]
MSDPFDLLRHHVRRQAADAEPGTSTDELVAHITLEHHRNEGAAGARVRRPRRWGLVAMVVTAAAGVGAGAVVTATLDRPHLTQAGVACHSSVGDRSFVIVSLGNDPIAACAAVWQAGDLPLVDQKSPPSDPPLVACTGDRGVFDVYPGTGPEVCAQVGLVEADVEAMLGDPVLELSRRISDEINAQCLSFEAAVERARELLDELQFSDWKVNAIDDGGVCALVGMDDTGTRALNVRTVPDLD